MAAIDTPDECQIHDADGNRLGFYAEIAQVDRETDLAASGAQFRLLIGTNSDVKAHEVAYAGKEFAESPMLC